MFKIEKVDRNNFKHVPSPCKYCLYWQTNGPFDEKTLKPEMEHEKREWFNKVTREFGNCGFTAYFSGVPIGFIQYAPTKFFHGKRSTPLDRQAKTPSSSRAFTLQIKRRVEKDWGQPCLKSY